MMLNRRRLLAAGISLTAPAAPVQALPARPEVDLLLVLAVDTSGSVDRERFELQKLGYAAAFRNARVAHAIASGPNHSIAVCMSQWTGPNMQALALDWTRLSDEASVAACAEAIATGTRLLFGGGTSISGAIDHAVGLLREAPFAAERRVIDISGDGANNRGRAVAAARDEAVADGIVINGLPILAVEPDLEKHYREQVIGGNGAFLIATDSYDNFAEAILRKLVAEIAARPWRGVRQAGRMTPRAVPARPGRTT
jgi:hypothetical protein